MIIIIRLAYVIKHLPEDKEYHITDYPFVVKDRKRQEKEKNGKIVLCHHFIKEFKSIPLDEFVKIVKENYMPCDIDFIFARELNKILKEKLLAGC